MPIQLEANVGQFSQQMKQAEASVRQLGSAAKLAESEFKLTGNAAQYQQQKTEALTRQIEAQQRAVTAARRGLQTMATLYGQNSSQAQEWQAKLNTASARLNTLQADLNATAAGTDRLQQGMKGASTETRTLSQIAANSKFQALNTALTNIGNAASKTAQKIKSLGQTVWNAGKASSDWADDLMTDASRYGVDTKTLQQWQYAARFVDTEVSTIAMAMNKTRGGMTGSSKAAAEALKTLGVTVKSTGGSMADVQDTFWDAVDALGKMRDEVARDDLAQQLFGKSFADLKPLIDAGRDSWAAYCDEAERAGRVMDESQVRKLGSFNDSLQRMDASFASLKNGFMAELAPGFEAIADSVADAAGSLLQWAQSAEGQETLGNFTDAIKSMIDSLADGGAKKLIDGITDALNRLGDAARWVGENAGAVTGLLKIGGGVAVGAKTAGGIVKGVSTIKTIGSALGIGGSAAAGGTAAAGTAGSAAATGGMMTTLKALPAAVGKGVASAVSSSVGTSAIGFAGGIAAVLGVGALAKALAGETRDADFGGASGRRQYEERNRQRQELADEKHQQGIEDSAARAASDVVAAIEGLKEDTDWRTRQNRESLTGMTKDDIIDAINSADLGWGRGGGEEEGHVTVEAEVKLTGDAVRAALADGKITEHEIEEVQKYVNEHFTPAVEEAVGLIKGGWDKVKKAMEEPPSDNEPDTELEVLEYTALSKWVQDTMGTDLAKAKEDAKALWLELITAAGSPGDMQDDLAQTAEEAKASGTNKTWNAMVKWVQDTMGLDLSAAEQKVSQMWQQLGTYATSARRHPELNNEYTPTGETSKVFQNYVKAMFGADYDEAKKQLDTWLEDLDKSVQNHQPKEQPNGEDGSAPGVEGSTYLTGTVAELVKVKGEIDVLVADIAAAVAQGIPVDEASLNRLDYLMGRAEKLSGEVSWYESEAAVAGRGAMGMAMSGQNWEKSAPLGLAYARDLRMHELERIEKEVGDKEAAAGNAFIEFSKAYEKIHAMERLGTTGGEEYETAKAEYETAKTAYETAQKEYDDAEAKADERRNAVNQEYADNVSEIMNGAAKVVKYAGNGKAVIGQGYTAESTAAGWAAASPYVAAGLSGYAMGTARNWANPWAGTEAGDKLNRRQAAMTPLQREMADALYSRFGGSYEKFMSSLPADQLSAMESLLGYTSGNGAESDFWSDIMFNAFGKAPANTYLSEGGLPVLGNAQATDAWKWMAAFLDFKPRETQAQSEASLRAEAQAQADAMNAILQQYADTLNEEGGYNAYHDIVKQWADAGVFEGIDWSQIDGGAVEDTLADLASEAQAAGEQVGEGYGTGMESSRDTVVNAGDEVGSAGIDALKEAAGVNSPSIYGIETGKFIDEGIVQGLLSGSGAVADAARSVARAAVSAIRSELDIHSPSRVMAGLGSYTAQGFADGIASSVDSVYSAMSAVRAAVTRPVADRAGTAAGGGNTYNASAGLYIDRYYQNSAEDIGYIRDELTSMQRREFQGFGHRR